MVEARPQENQEKMNLDDEDDAYDELADMKRVDEKVRFMLTGIADQVCKEQYFNATHRIAELLQEVARRHQQLYRQPKAGPPAPASDHAASERTPG